MAVNDLGSFFAIDDIPAFRLTEFSVFVFARIIVIGVDLNGKVLIGIKYFR